VCVCVCVCVYLRTLLAARTVTSNVLDALIGKDVETVAV